MASLFGHALAAAALGAALRPRRPLPPRFWGLALLGAVAPDADVIAFRLGIPYEHLLGHRGLSHSLLVAALWGWAAAGLGFRGFEWEGQRARLFACFFAAAASHGALDAFTDGGLGVAFFAPFSGERLFFPWTPIRVSPIGAGRFFSKWGLAVLASEALWIGVPSIALLGAARLLRRPARSS